MQIWLARVGRCMGGDGRECAGGKSNVDRDGCVGARQCMKEFAAQSSKIEGSLEARPRRIRGPSQIDMREGVSISILVLIPLYHRINQILFQNDVSAA